MTTRLTRGFAGSVLIFVAGVLSGCPKGGDTGVDTEADHIVSVRKAYLAATARLGHPPNNLEELKPSLAAQGNVDQLLISPNDGLPYVILYGTDPRKYVFAYEAKGKEGVRVVVDQGPFAKRVTTEEFDSLRFPPGYKKPGGHK